MDFFNDCKTHDEAKSTFKRLCKHFHPDKGGEESLMIELKKQYDSWQPSQSQYKFHFNMVNRPLESVYDNKINELNGLIYHLRCEVEALRSNNTFSNNRLQDEIRDKRFLREEINRTEQLCEQLNVQIKELKDELTQEREKNSNRTLADKIKMVFGYE